MNKWIGFCKELDFGYHKNIGLVKLFISTNTQTDYEDLNETEPRNEKISED